jgi:hypothetical protein
VDRKNLRLFVIGGLLVALGLALFVSPFASGSPDGLERVAIDKGFAETQKDHSLQESPLAGYQVRGVGNDRISTGLAGVLGVTITFGVAMILFGAMRTIRARRGPAPSSASGP